LIIIYSLGGEIKYTIENEYNFNKNNLENNQRLIVTDNENIKTNTHYIAKGEPKLKEKINININSQKIKAGEVLKLTLETEKTNTEIKMKINDIEFSVKIENNQGAKKIELKEPDGYKISCIDHRFISQSVKVEVV